jgi:RHS repeat-associated protein
MTPRTRHVGSRTVVIVGATALALSLFGLVPAIAGKSAFKPLKPQQEHSVSPLPNPTAPKLVDPAAAAAVTSRPAPVWPAAGTADADLAPLSDPRVRERGSARPGTLPVLLQAPAGTATAPQGRVQVGVLDRAKVPARYRDGVVVSVRRTDTDIRSAGVGLTVDYSGFRTAYGGDWASRLHLTMLPACALTTPDAPGCQGTPLPTRNDPRAATASADVPLAASGQTATTMAASTNLVALTAGTSGAAGSFAATSLAPSSTWQAGGPTGNFSWTYPMRMPPSLGGPAPPVSLAYSSQSVDGHTAASNNQPSWLGEGFSYSPGFIERSYKGCSDDMGGTANNSVKTGDECWATDNATLSFSGGGGELVRDDATGTWHARQDDGTRIEHLTGATNGDNDGEYWRVTTTDGTQYYFGLNRLTGWTAGKPTTNSAWTVPVFGNNTGEPCHQSTFAASSCDQAYRWNLDYVVDVDGNTLSYWYDTETNHYARNLTDSAVSTFVRGGSVSRIDYGTDNRSGTDTEFSGSAPMRVLFTTADRCIPGSVCDFAHPTSWPDTPLDLNCSSTSSCPGQYGPSFWTQKRLASVRTQVWDGVSAYKDVEQWTLNHTYPDPGDSTRAGLWLSSISHTGLYGGTASLPDIRFTGVQLANRVDTSTDQRPAMNWWRISYIDTESGDRIGVTYAPPDCVAGSRMPASPDQNTLRCYPVKWTPSGYTSPITDYFHTYIVTAVTETDLYGGSPRVITTYSYPGTPAWHYVDDNGLVPDTFKTWSQFRGYDRVNVTKGDPGEQVTTSTLFFRGMDGDKLSSGTRQVRVTDSQGGSLTDSDGYSGLLRETVTYNGSTEVSGEVVDPWQSAPTATRSAGGLTVSARHSNRSAVHTRTALDGGRGVRRVDTVNTFDTYGMLAQVADSGDTSTATDDRCTTYTYARNTSRWLMASISRQTTYALPCGQNPTRGEDVVSDVRTSYDSQSYGAAPTLGKATAVEALKTWSATSPEYVTTARSAFDPVGRETDRWDVAGNHTTTAYTPATGGPLTSVTGTNALGWSETGTYAPAWGAVLSQVDVNGKRTDATYDPLGRRTAVWLPGRDKATQSASTTYAYTIPGNGLNSVATSSLAPSGGYVTNYTLYDGLLRQRQQQWPAIGGGRLLTDNLYNTAGLLVKQNKTYYNADAGPGTTLFVAPDNQVPQQTVLTYDGAGRETAAIVKSNGVEQWRATTYYGGDHTDVTPPAGATPTARYTDARGNVVNLRQFQGSAPTGAYDQATYAFNGKGQLTTVTDAAGNHWDTTYDQLDRVVSTSGPDRGTSTYTYDDAGDLLTATDPRGRVIVYTYDTLGRRTGEYDTSTSGTQLASWTYDTLAKGYPTAATRYVNGNAYTVANRGYTDEYKSTGTNVTIPTGEGALTGTYVFTNTYNADGSMASTRMPAAGGLPAETLQYGYDAGTGLSTTLKANYGGVSTSYVTDTQYTKLGEPAVTTYSTGGQLAQEGLYYDEPTRRLAESVTVKETAPSTVADVHYSYTATGQVTKIADTPAGGSADTQCFRHDYLGRTTAAWTPASGDCATDPTAAGLGGPAPYWQSWTFDVTGNRQTQVEHATAHGDATTQYTYPAAGSAAPHTLTGASRTDSTGTVAGSYGYDPAGNTLNRPGPAGPQTLTWDLEGHLNTIADSTGTTSYVYDTMGNRLLSKDPTGTTLNLGAMELRLTNSTGQVAATRYYTLNGKVRAVRTAAGVSWLMGDRQGSELIAIASSGQQVTRRYQSPYGGSRGTPVTLPGTKGFVGGTVDGTGLVHLGAREYDPLTGRFVSPDPVQNADDPQQMNGYSYGDDAPETNADPSGLCPSWLCGTAKNIWHGVTSTVDNVRHDVVQGYNELRHDFDRGLDIVREHVTNFANGLVQGLNQIRHAISDGLARLRHNISDAFAHARHWVSDKFAHLRHSISDKFAHARHWVAVHGPNALRRAWHVTRFVVNIPSTLVGLGVAYASGASCGWYREAMVVCRGSSWIPSGRSGYTIGNVYVQHDKTMPTADEMRHETKHATQYFFFGGDPLEFGVAYAGASLGSWLVYKVKGPRHDSQGMVCDTPTACYNPFEESADLHDGNYYHR